MTSETREQYIKELLQKASEEVYKSFPGKTEVSVVFTINRPQAEFGDYATNIAMLAAKQLKKNPAELAQAIAEEFKKLDGQKVFSEVSAAGGFINFRLSEAALLENLNAIQRQKENYGSSTIGGNQKILVEYFQPNIAKPLHLGHLRTAIIGDCLFKLFKFSGFSPESDTHLGDWGTQFGLLLYAYKKYGNLEVIEKNPIEELNKLYIKINAEAEADESVREAGKAEFVKLEQGDTENRELWKKFKEYSWREFEIVYRDLEIRRSDHDWPESFFEDKMPAVLMQLKEKGLLKESQGAQIVDLEEYNLGTALLVKSDGGTTYLLRDLATFIYRKSQGFEKQYYVVDVRQSHTLNQTFKIIELLGHAAPGEAIHVSYGFLTLPEGAMSTRKGTVVGAKEFIESVKARALEIIKEKNPDLKDKEEVARRVASGAMKYFDLSHNIKSDIVFDPKKAISFEGNTGPYLQYTHARIHGILRKIKDLGLKVKAEFPKSEILNLKSEEFSVLRKLCQFPEIVEQAAADLQPNTIANYLFELSQTFNAFYQEIPVLREEDEQIKEFRLKLITATAQVLKNGLLLLGIDAPEEM
jgi:arginyl-tRNA synthetase